MGFILRVLGGFIFGWFAAEAGIQTGNWWITVALFVGYIVSLVGSYVGQNEDAYSRL